MASWVLFRASSTIVIYRSLASWNIPRRTKILVLSESAHQCISVKGTQNLPQTLKLPSSPYRLSSFCMFSGDRTLVCYRLVIHWLYHLYRFPSFCLCFCGNTLMSYKLHDTTWDCASTMVWFCLTFLIDAQKDISLRTISQPQ